MIHAPSPNFGTAWRTRGQRLFVWLQPVVVVAALLTLPLTIAEVNGQEGYAFAVADWIVWLVFVVEYAVGFAVSQDRRRYVYSARLGLVVVIVSFPLLPSLFALARLARIARLFRLVRLIAFGARAIPALKASLGRRGLLYVLGLFVLLIVMAGALMSVTEPKTVHGDMWNGMWWAIVTATTVGYGDISPVSLPGRIIAVALMLFGIGLTATLAASVAAFFVRTDQGSELQEVTSRLERLERLLEEVKSRL